MIRTILFIVVLVAMFTAILAMGWGLSYGETEKNIDRRADVCVYITMGAMFVMLCAFGVLLHLTEINMNN